MIHNHSRYLLYTVLLLSFFAVSAVVAAEGLVLPADPIEMQWSKRPVQFSHSTHFSVLKVAAPYSNENCITCHHPVDGKEQLLACATKGCHDNFDKEDESTRSYFMAIHKEEEAKHTSCVGCHLTSAGDDLAVMKKLGGCKDSTCHP